MLVRSNDFFPVFFTDVFNHVNDTLNRNLARDPQINISESDHNFRVEFLVPCLTKDDLSITLDVDNNLVVAMNAKESTSDEVADATTTVDQKHDEKFQYLRHDFQVPHFKKVFALPDCIHKDRITAKVENGVLRILLPKITPEEQSRLTQTITIE